VFFSEVCRRQGFGFRAGVGKKPAGQSAGEATGNISARRASSRNGSAQAGGRARCCILKIGLRFVNFRLGHWRRRRSCGLSTVLGQRFAREKNGFFRGSAWCGGTRSFRRAVVKAALCGATGFKTTRRTPAIFRAALIAAAIVVTARLVSTRVALRRRILRRRKIATSGTLRATSAPLAPATAAPSSATATVAASVTTTISTASKILAAALAAAIGARRVVLSGIVVRRKILRCGGVRIWLSLFGSVMRIVVHFGGVGAESFVRTGLVLFNAGVPFVRQGIVMRRFLIG
jgi:hypothetical protein